MGVRVRVGVGVGVVSVWVLRTSVAPLLVSHTVMNLSDSMLRVGGVGGVCVCVSGIDLSGSGHTGWRVRARVLFSRSRL